MKECFEYGMIVEKIINFQKKFDVDKIGNEIVRRKGIGIDNQKFSFRFQSLLKESLWELGMKGVENCEEKMIFKFEVSEKISFL